MKKISLLILFTMLLFSVCACKRAEPTGDMTVVEKTFLADSTAYTRLALATGTVSGNYYPFSGALSQVVDEATGYIRLDVRLSNGSVENIGMLKDGQAQLAMVQNDMLHYAFHALNMWEDETPATNIAALMTLYPEICQVIVPAGSDIQSVADLKGRRVAVGEQDSALSANAEQILAVHDLTFEDIQIKYRSFADAAQAMKDKTIDAMFVTMGTPNKGVMDLQAECPLRVVGLADEAIESLIEKYPFYTKVVLNANDYSFLEEEVNTVAVRATLSAAASLDEQVVYDIVKAIIEGREKIAVAHAKGSFISAESAVSGLSVELHPGARRYFKEIGVLE